MNSQISNEWIADSVCTAHMTYDRSDISNYSKTDTKTIDLCASSTADVLRNGDVSISLFVDDKRTICEIKEVKHIPTLR